MRTLTFLAPGKLEWREVPDAALQAAGDALVRPLAVAACDLDVALLRGHAPFPGPFPLGHEFVAEIVEVGADVAAHRRGDRVIVPFQISCGVCDRCRRGLTGSCRAVPPVSMFGFRPLGGDWGGALADLVRVPYASHMLVPLPPGVDAVAMASASDNVADGWRAVAPPLAEFPGAPVLIVGGIGSVPLYAVAVARAHGASRVDYVDTDEARLALAAALGATAIPASSPPARGATYPITVDGSGDPQGLVRALRALEPEGICTSVSIYFEDVPMPLLRMYTRGTRFVTGRVNSRAVLPHVLDLVTSGRLHPERVTSAVVPWDDAADALRAPALKPIVVRS
ncbi:MAG TPA: alcohol dehydrogenase catalytic domain-containing protein [Methylomirabilota bacterium]